MADITQADVNAWFAANPNASTQDVANAIQSVGGLTPAISNAVASHYGTDVGTVQSAFNKIASTPPRPYIPIGSPIQVTPPLSIPDRPYTAYSSLAPVTPPPPSGGLLTPPPANVSGGPVQPFQQLSALQNNVNQWFTNNPNATGQQISDAIKAAGGLNAELSQAIANRVGTTASAVQSAYTKLNPSTASVTAPAYVAPTLSGNATGRDLQLEMAKIFTNNLDPNIIKNTPQTLPKAKPITQMVYEGATEDNPYGTGKKISQQVDVGPDFTGLTPDWAGTPSDPIQTYRKSVSPLIDAIYNDSGKLTGYEASNNAYLSDKSYVHGSFDVTGKANPVYQTKSAGGFFQGQLPAMAALYGGALGANALGLGSEATGTGLFSSSVIPPENPFLSGMTAENAISGAGVAGATGGSYALANVPLTAEQIASIAAANSVEESALTGLTGSQLGKAIADGTLIAPTGVLKSIAGAGAGAGAATGLLSGASTAIPTDIATKIATGVGTGLLTNTLTGGAGGGGTGGGMTGLTSNVLQSGLNLGANVVQSQADKAAQLKAQQDILNATQQATTGAQFRPVGVTTRFGASQFQIDPATGQLVSAGYTASPEITSAQNQLMNLGSSYLAQTPEQVAQQYLSKQYELLDPSRQRQLAAIRNQNFQTGRGGLSVGSTGLRPSGAQGLMGANPELEAYYNALAQQDAQLATNAQQAGQQQVTYGAGLFNQAGNLESLAQQPFTLGTGLGTSISGAGANAGRINLAGQQIAAGYGTNTAATTNPYATVLAGATNPNTAIGQGIYNWLNSTAPVDTSGVGGGITSSGMNAATYNDIYGGGYIPAGYANF